MTDILKKELEMSIAKRKSAKQAQYTYARGRSPLFTAACEKYAPLLCFVGYFYICILFLALFFCAAGEGDPQTPLPGQQ